MKTRPMPQQTKKYLVLSIYFALAVSALLVFWQVRNFDFVYYDDDVYVYDNPHVLNGLTADSVSWAVTTGYGAFWHPLTWLSLILDGQFYGSNPAGFHLTNLFLHLANTLLLFTVFKKMTGALWPSAFIAALFALHPLHVESVAWIAERKDVLSTFFWLLTMLAYAQYVKKPGIVRYLLTLLIFALGLIAKPMLVTLPFVFLLLDYWPLDRIKNFNRQNIYRLILEKIPFFALAVVSSVIAFLVQQSAGAVSDIDNLPLKYKIANAFLSYTRYIGKMFWPQNLAVFYPFNAASISFSQAAACALLLLGISFFVVYYGRNRRYLPVGWFWFVGTLVPVIGFVQVGIHAYADRYTYITLTGLFIIIAWGMSELLAKSPHRKIILGVSMVIVLTTLGIFAHRQTSCWKNSIALFSHAIKVTRNNYIAYNNLGAAYNGMGRYTEAIEEFRQAAKIRSNYADAQYNLGSACSAIGRWSEAVEAFSQVIRIKPDDAEARYNLGLAYLAIGDKNSALAQLDILKSLNPKFANDLLKQINK